VYLLIVVNFHSWLDPFIMISALPAALAGIAWFLFITHTTLSVPALMGAIMCMGVATSNSILVVSFATEKMTEGSDSVSAALEANPHCLYGLIAGSVSCLPDVRVPTRAQL
jgi:multidrug efflux pump subunit AcrB